jgi:hypothetical protein
VRASNEDSKVKLRGLHTALGLVCLFLISFPAAADVYPVNGVWAAPNPEFPVAIDETCFTINTFGVEAVSRRSIAEMIIFTNDKRYDVKGQHANRKQRSVGEGGRRRVLDN